MNNTLLKTGISIVSTYAQDILCRENGTVISKQPGGPIIFLEAAIKQSKIPYNLFSTTALDVEILMSDSGEISSKIQKPTTISSFPYTKVFDWTIISTLLNEWDLDCIDQYAGKLFIDIQGYVRTGKKFGEKKIWEEGKKFNQHIFCLKGTQEELSYLPQEVYDDQKKRLLIATGGRNAVELFFEGEKYMIPVKK